MKGICENNNLVIRWTFGETVTRPTSLQAFDMLQCSVSFAKLLFPNARKVICYNSLKSQQSFNKLTEIGIGIELIECKASLAADKGKNSFWKYFPLRLDSSKHELVLDNDVVFWNVPSALTEWLGGDGLLMNTDWKGQYYGEFQNKISNSGKFNAGVLGYPPGFDFILPDLSKMPELFHSEQGFIVKTFLESGKKIFMLDKDQILQSNAEEMKRNDIAVTEQFCGGHFCGCSYGHYYDWDKHYKDKIWKEYFTRCGS